MCDTATVREFGDYLARSPRRYAPDTIRARLSIVRRYTAAVDWSTASVHDVERWANSLGIGATATRTAVSHVRAFYRWAIRTERATVDPTATVDLPRVPKRLPRPARDVAIMVSVSAADPSMRAMLALMAGAGLRCCEVAGLRWSDVDMIAGTVHVTGKYDRERVIAIGPPVRQALAAVDGPTSYVFVNAAGRPLTPCRVSQLVNGHLRRCAAGCTAHQLRHRFATSALAACHDMTTVRDLLGHSSVSTTEIYAAVVPDAGGAVSVSVSVPGL
jgi:site-specific recombinase XerD